MFFSVLDFIIILVLGSYLLITIAYHFDQKKWISSHLDYFGFIPKWNFFAPNPGVHNLYLLFRLQYNDGTISSWKSILDMDQYRDPWTFIWNPNKRVKKALFDLLVTLTSEDISTEENRAKVKMSIPYLLFLNHLNCYKEDIAVSVQFTVMENYYQEPAYPIFTSELHTL